MSITCNKPGQEEAGYDATGWMRTCVFVIFLISLVFDAERPRKQTLDHTKDTADDQVNRYETLHGAVV